MTSLREAVDYEAAAKALYNAKPEVVSGSWPLWEDLRSGVRALHLRNARAVVDAALAPFLLSIREAAVYENRCETHRCAARDDACSYFLAASIMASPKPCNIVPVAIVPAGLIGGGETR